MLGDGGCAGDDPPVQYEIPGGARGGEEVHAVVLIEALVLCGDGAGDEFGWKPVSGNGCGAGGVRQGEVCDGSAVAVEHDR